MREETRRRTWVVPCSDVAGRLRSSTVVLTATGLAVAVPAGEAALFTFGQFRHFRTALDEAGGVWFVGPQPIGPQSA